MKLAIISADFHKDIAAEMLAAAQTTAAEMAVEIIQTVTVPGAYEIPLVAEKLLTQPAVDALVVLGFIEKGETLHGEVMGHVVHKTLVELELKYSKPIGIGIIGPGATPEQAKVRATPNARGAVQAVAASVALLASLR